MEGNGQLLSLHELRDRHAPKRRRIPALAPSLAVPLARPLPVFLGCCGLLVPMLSHNDSFKVTFGFTIEGLALMPLFSLAMLQGGKGWLRCLTSTPIMWLSRISYPL